MKSVIEWLKENSLSLTMLCLFLGFLYADSATGWHSFNQQQANQGFPQLGYWQYLGTGAFIDGLFVNWQAAALQLTALIIFSEFMQQRGASHSRKTDEEREQGQSSRHGGRKREQRETRGGGRSDEQPRRWWQAAWLYRNSLSLAFIALFCGAFAVHIVFGADAYNEKRVLRHQPPIGTLDYLTSSTMWADTFQTWEAEFFVMWFFLIASIYLRQEYSSESKALGAGIKDTGDPQE